MKTNIKRLPDAELEVMQAIWACEEPVARVDIEAILKDTHPMAMTTLLTLLTRLAEKEFIRIEKVSRSARYYPLVSQQEYLAQQSKNFLQRLFVDIAQHYITLAVKTTRHHITAGKNGNLVTQTIAKTITVFFFFCNIRPIKMLCHPKEDSVF